MSVHLVALTLAACVAAAPALAQTPLANAAARAAGVEATTAAHAATATAATGGQEKPPEPPPAPDPGTKEESGDGWNVWKTKAVNTTMVLTFGADLGSFVQDDTNKEQVKRQPPLVKWRAERINFGGTLNFKNPWVWQVGGNFNGLEAEKGNRWMWLDVRLDIPVSKTARLRIGRQKVGVSHEWVMALIDWVYMERATSSLFVPQRQVGVIMTDTYAKGRVMWSAGAFNDWFAQGNSFSANGTQYGARISVLPMDPGPNKEGTLLQVGASVFYRGATNGKLQFRSRPEINQSDYFIDTGKFEASHSVTSQFEAMALMGRTQVFGEWAMTPTSAPKAGNPLIYGGFAGFGYRLTNEHRPVNRREGNYWPRLSPQHPVGRGGWGAWEVGARYSYTDATSGTIDGGRISRWTGVINWYPDRQWMLRFDYGYITLDRFGKVGHAHGLSARIAWNM